LFHNLCAWMPTYGYQSVQRTFPKSSTESLHVHFGNVWRTFVRLGRID